jgi:ferredoxin-thioredoxin reductase catalytic chain
VRVWWHLLINKGRAETTDEDEIRKWVEEFARKNGWVLNPDKKILDTVIRGLARNEKKFGERYCPCRLRSGDKDKDRVIICPCVYHKNEIAKDGHCHCQLYFRKDAADLVMGEIE